MSVLGHSLWKHIQYIIAAVSKIGNPKILLTEKKCLSISLLITAVAF